MSYENENISSSPRIPLKLSAQPWLDLTIPFACLINGQPRSGKTKLVDWFVDMFYKYGFLVIWLYSAKGFENLFPVINKDCKLRWQAIIAKDETRSNELPACQCHGIIPILWIVPKYFEIEQESLDRFNGVYWRNWDEYNDQYLKGNPDVDEYLPPLFDVTKIKKPARLRPYPVLKIITITPPITEETTKTFRSEFLNAVKIAKKERRMIVNTPSACTPDHKGKKEEYSIVAEGLRYIQGDLMNESIMKRLKPAEGKELTRHQKNNHKAVVILTELKNVAPNPKLSPDIESSISKRALYAFLPEKRHGVPTWVIADCQSATDIFDGVRMQFSDLKVFKRTTLALAGEENKAFYQHIDNLCNSYYENWGFNPRNVPTSAKLMLLKRYNLCRISELPDNKAMVKLENGEHILKTVKHARFHHKDDKIDNFFEITGIKYTITRKEEKSTTKERTTKSASMKATKDGIMLRIQQMIQQKMSFATIVEELTKLEQDGTIRPDSFPHNGKSLNKAYGRWLDRLSKSGMNLSKQS